MRYLCLIYHEDDALENLAPDSSETVVRDTFEYRKELRQRGHWITASPVESADTAMSVRVRHGDVVITDGPYAETKEQLGGVYLIEGRDLNEAIRLASKIPSARLGCIEVRALKELIAP